MSWRALSPEGTVARGGLLRALAAVIGLTALAAPAVLGAQASAKEILDATGVTGGVIVHLGCGDGTLTAALRANDGCLVHGLDTDAAKVEQARKHIQSKGLYGVVAVDRWDGKRLPYVDNFVNLVVASVKGQVSSEEIARVLAPRGRLLIASGSSPDTRHLALDTRSPAGLSGWTLFSKPVPQEIDDWTHYFHDATGNPVAHDSVVGPPRRLQWVGGPRWSRHHDHMASMTSLVSAKGRLFYIFDEGPTASVQLPSQWRLIARDGFNGTVLWKRDIGQWNTRQWPLKSGPAHLTRRLVAVGDRVYVTLSLEAPATALDATTGKTLLTYNGSERTREILVTDGMVLALVGLKPSRLPEWRRRHSYVWDNTRRANSEWAWAGETRRIAAYDAKSGRPLWSAESPVAPCSLAADATRVILYDGAKVVCLNRATGAPLWKSDPIPASMPVHTGTGPRTLLYKNVVLFAGNNRQMTALSASDGKTLWQSKKHPSGHMSLKDLFVVNGVVWSGAIANGKDSGVFTGRDPLTGKVVKEFPPDVKIYWFHHRCHPSKATDRYLLTSRTGIEFIDPATQHWETHHWVRGGCIYGVLPCNGLVYAPMQSCGCYLESKLNGFNALAPGPVPKPDAAARVERGPAFGSIGNRQSQIAHPADWPTYRHDPARSGATPSPAPSAPKEAWRAQIGGRLSAPVIAEGRAYVAAIDAHAVHALDAATGKALWVRTVGGRVDSPPTIHRGLVLFGCADGHVYALRATDGELAWRFRAAPMDRRHLAFEQLESVWPVHGSVLVHNGVLYCTAGRSIFLDGGIRFLRLDPMTGRKLGEAVWDERDPETGKNMQMHVKSLNMPVALSDVLSCDGTHLYMRSQKITLEGKRVEIPVESVENQPAEGSHLFCQVGFLDDSWFHRSFWTFGRRVTGGYGGWLIAGRMVPAGRILAFDDTRVYGYGRKPQYYTNASVLEHHLFAAAKHVTPEAIAQVRRGNARMNRRSDKKNASSSDWKVRRPFPVDDLTAARYGWAFDQPSVQVRAMVVAENALVVAGHPDAIDERRAYRLPDDPDVQKKLQQQAEALAGRHGGRLWIVSKADGKPTGRYRLASPPVFDGMAAAQGRLFVSGLDGSVTCLASDGATPLAPADDAEPTQVISKEPEEPNYLKPAAVDKSGDFSMVSRCEVLQSKLGYRLRPKAQKQTGLALNKLKAPITGTATLRAKIMVPGAQGFLRNGFIAFGDGTSAEKLIHCGIRYQPQKALIMQGGLTGDAKSKGVDVKALIGKVLDLVVRVDLAKQTVAFTANTATVDVKLAKPLKSITHVGFSMDSAVVEFSPLDIAK